MWTGDTFPKDMCGMAVCGHLLGHQVWAEWLEALEGRNRHRWETSHGVCVYLMHR